MVTAALYDIGRMIAGFDFYPWLVMQVQEGATEIVFNKQSPKMDKYPMDQVLRRFESIIRPGPALAGLPYSFGTVGAQLAPFHQKDLVARCYAGIPVPRLKSVLPSGKERYTVTLRNIKRNPTRNSIEADWREFAAEIGARVIPDYEDEPIHLHERMALYAGAEMNLFVSNGPVMLCFLSDCPAMGFDLNQSNLGKLGVRDGQYPWLLPDRHRQIHETATLDVIRKHFYRWRDHHEWI
mgnify:CR=1 FL=1